MVIKKEQAKHLLALLESPKREIDVSKMNREGLEELEMAGLVTFPTPAFVSLTYGGEMVARALRSAIEKGAVEEVGRWDPRFRWVGSEILAMMENARRNGTGTAVETGILRKGPRPGAQGGCDEADRRGGDGTRRFRNHRARPEDRR